MVLFSGSGQNKPQTKSQVIYLFKASIISSSELLLAGFLCDSFLSQEKRPAILEAIGSIGVWREESGEMAELTELELENYR